jgi:hypothetical protein
METVYGLELIDQWLKSELTEPVIPPKFTPAAETKAFYQLILYTSARYR